MIIIIVDIASNAVIDTPAMAAVESVTFDPEMTTNDNN